MNTFTILLSVAIVGGIVFYAYRKLTASKDRTSSNAGSTTGTATVPTPVVEDPRKPQLGTGEDLMLFTKRELLDMAKAQGVKVNQRMSKSSIASALESQVNESE